MRMTEADEAGVLDPQAVASSTVSYLRDVVDAAGVVLYRWDDIEGALVPFASAGVETPDALPMAKPGQGIAGNAYVRRSSVLVDDYVHSDSVTTWGQNHHITCGYAVPLMVGRRTMGVLAAYFTIPRSVDLTRQRMVSLVAQNVGPTLQVVQLLDDAQRSVAETVTLAKLIRDGAADANPERACSRVCEVASRLLGSDFAVIGECESDGTVRWRGLYGANRSNWDPEHHPPGEWPLQELVAGGTTIVISDARNDQHASDMTHARHENARTVVLAPLGELAGATGILLLGWRIDVVVTPHQRTLAETLASHATTIVRHARELQKKVDASSEPTREAHYRALCEHAADLMLVLDDELIIRYASDSHATVLGRPAADLVGHSAFDWVAESDKEAVIASCAAAAHTPTRLHVRAQHADGSARDMDVLLSHTDSTQTISGWVINARDTTERVAEHIALTHQATHDLLTHLPNRTHFADRLRHALIDANAGGHSVSLLLLDLNRFKEINDAFGHEFGDRVLQEVAERLRHLLRRGQTIARYGGDEFAIVLPQVAEGLTRAIIEQALAALDEPFEIDGHSVTVAANFGVALYPEDGLDGATLLRHADSAMHFAKRSRRGYAFYDHAADPHSPARLTVIKTLREAIAKGELRIDYQPKLHLAAQTVRDAEALTRWPGAAQGFANPDEFIPLAEHTGMITSLTGFVLETAFRQWHEWKRHITPPGVAINLSMESFRDPNLPKLIFAAIEKHDMAYTDVCLELTESALMADPDRAYAIVREIAERGVRFSVDDFGTGYSSLAYLKRFDVVEIKIDKVFVSGMAENRADRAIVGWIVELGHSLGLEVVAEGVEDHETTLALEELGCDMIQGFTIARPMTGADYLQWTIPR
jgi:diguanylate cyclase (GGDEF)-like protein/PAS domain S-box-containing protein